MTDFAQKQVSKALLDAIKPIVAILLRTGIGFREFSEIAKTAFVDVATNSYGLRGRPTNISRVAVMTGLTRKEIRRLRDNLSGADETVFVKSTPLANIVHQWFTDSAYCDEHGKPLALPFEGSKKSFSSLVKRFGGDIPPGAMRTELKRMGMVSEGEDGLLVPLKRNVAPVEDLDRLVTGLIKGLYPMALTLSNNLDPANKGSTWVQRSAQTKYVREEDLATIRRVCRDRLTEFTESIDDLLTAYEVLHKDSATMEKQKRAIGVGVFYFEEDKSKNDYFG